MFRKGLGIFHQTPMILYSQKISERKFKRFFHNYVELLQEKLQDQ